MKAIEYYEKSAKLNNSNVLNNLGFLYKNGEGFKRVYLKAKTSWTSLADDQRFIFFFEN